MSKIDSFHSYLQATKDMAQSVVHRYHTCDEEPDVAWEIIEDIMEGLIAVFLDMFSEEENPTHKNLTESDMERDIDSLEERIDELEATVEQLLSSLEQERDARERFEKDVGEEKVRIDHLFTKSDRVYQRLGLSESFDSVNVVDYRIGTGEPIPKTMMKITCETKGETE